jgi:hypothetical protein
MTQNARLALYIPTGPDADPGEIIEVRGNAAIGAPIPTRFFAQAGSTGGIGEAPIDNKIYGRAAADWAETVTVAPNDGTTYAQKNGAWLRFVPFPEAPADGKPYARQDVSWVQIPPFPGIIDGGVF